MFDHIGLGGETGYWLQEQDVENLGIDAPAIENSGAAKTKGYPVHDMCAEDAVLHMENLANIDSVVGQRVQFAAFPLEIDRGTGSPIRLVAIIE